MLTFIKDVGIRMEKSGRNHMYALARCDCGNEIELRKGRINTQISCGCSYGESNFKRRNIIEDGYKPEGSILTFVKDLGRGDILTICDCGNEKILEKSRFLSLQTKSCGCFKNRKGIDNPKYKGTTSKYDTIRTSKEYSEWRTKCFERDNYTCQITGIKGNGDLVVHHLNPFHKLIVNTTENDYSEYIPLWDINNGVTLLESTHKKFHDMYGYNNFTEEDFKNFMESKPI